MHILYHTKLWWGNFDVLDVFQPDHQNLTCQNFKALQHLATGRPMVKDSDHLSKYFPTNT